MSNTEFHLNPLKHADGQIPSADTSFFAMYDVKYSCCYISIYKFYTKCFCAAFHKTSLHVRMSSSFIIILIIVIINNLSALDPIVPFRLLNLVYPHVP